MKRKSVDFGFAKTDGAFRVQATETGLNLTPLPESPPFRAALRLSTFGLEGEKIVRVIAHDAEEREAGATKWSVEDDYLILNHDGKAFRFDVETGGEVKPQN